MDKAPPFWRGSKVLITAGPTREYLDPVRYITNASSGRLGLALAAEARRRGARVVVVLGPTQAQVPRGVAAVPIVSARDMRREVLRRLRGQDVFIAAAAVGDWGAAKPCKLKIKKTGGPLLLKLKPNPDIVTEVGRRRAGRAKPLVVGFALETHGLRAHARDKLERKRMDMIVANGPENLGAARARFSILDRFGGAKDYPPMTKERAAQAIASAIERYAG